MSLPPMDIPVTQSESGRPAKRRRGSANSDESGSARRSGRRLSMSPGLMQIQTSTVTEAHSLRNEIDQLLRADPALASQAIHLVELYQCLWDCYVMEYASKVRVEEERRVLQDSNARLVGENGHLQQVCNFQQSLLWKQHRNFCSVHQGILRILQSCD
ncbi:hypothetical protein N7444_011608 [Penicillium canescens]|nr:hypothetical protein N7444_011608 [Penicillium canescens]